MRRPYLAFDLGASSGRAILGWEEGESFRLEEIHRFTNAPVARDGGLFWDLDEIWAQMLQALRLAVQRGVAPAAISVDTWGVDFGLLDERGQLLEPPRSYRDPRNAGLSRELAERIGAHRLLARTGSMFQDHASLCQLWAVSEHTPELLARAKKLLFVPDLLRLRLCGSTDSDGTIASTSQMYDARKRQWAADILEELGLPTAMLPLVTVGPHVAGLLSSEVQHQTGLGSVPVVSGGGHDTGAAFGACDINRLGPPEDLLVVSSGTWSILGVFVKDHLPAGSFNATQFGYEANPDGSLRLVRNLTGAWLIEQCRAEWVRAGRAFSHAQLISAAREAESSPRSTAVVDPQWVGFVCPASMTAAIAEFCRQSGQAAPVEPGEFARVIFTSLADGYARTVEQIRDMTGWPLRRLYLMGGLVRNDYLNELIARRSELRVTIGPAEAAAVGNLMLQRAALGRA